ncbi:MAG: hypothetical protein U0414_32665 [Polyangiaceae bacterium]
MNTSSKRFWASPAVAAICMAMASMFAAGCGKSPDAVCEKYLSLDADTRDPGPKRDSEKAECVAKLTQVQKEKPELFDTIATCMKSAENAGDAHKCGRKSKEVDK